MPRRLMFLPALVTAAMLAVTGCTGGDDDNDDAELPDADELLESAADEMAGVESVRLRLATDTDLADLPVRGADAVVTRAGDAEGTAEIEQLGQVLEIQFVMVGDAFHYQLVGDWVEVPRAEAAELYDPSAILDPDRGLSSLLRTAGDPEVQGTASVSGVDTYEVTASFAGSDLAAVLPGVDGEADGTLWIGQERPLLHKAEFEVPGGTVTADLSEFDEPVEISEP